MSMIRKPGFARRRTSHIVACIATQSRDYVWRNKDGSENFHRLTNHIPVRSFFRESKVTKMKILNKTISTTTATLKSSNKTILVFSSFPPSIVSPPNCISMKANTLRHISSRETKFLILFLLFPGLRLGNTLDDTNSHSLTHVTNGKTSKRGETQ
jgi:hypothetical protein